MAGMGKQNVWRQATFKWDIQLVGFGSDMFWPIPAAHHCQAHQIDKVSF
jgi:hypothetical protein